MSKVTKKQLLKRLEALEEWSNWADNMLDELNHALPDPEYDAKCEAEAADVDASLARHHKRLGLTKPQLKQLDQSVFDGLDEKWRFAAVDSDGAAFAFVSEPARHGTFWGNSNQSQFTRRSGKGAYDASNWQNSLIERDIAKELLEVDLSSELTGSELCKAMLARGDKYVMCLVGTHNDAVVIEGMHDNEFVAIGMRNLYRNPKPINNQGEPLTQAEAGL